MDDDPTKDQIMLTVATDIIETYREMIETYREMVETHKREIAHLKIAAAETAPPVRA